MQIVNTVDSNFFQANIPNGYRLRKEHEAEKRSRKFEVTKYMYDLIKGSNQITNGKQRNTMKILDLCYKFMISIQTLENVRISI